MSKKNALDMGSLLNSPHHQATTSTAHAPDPSLPTRLRVTLDQLVPYAENPRVRQNPAYEDIKESIRNRGLDHAPNITRRSPTDPYMIKDGGNTRLAILKELWTETGDTRFYELDAMFHPWTNDLDVLVGHMVENEARGAMLFIERAIAAQRIRGEIDPDQTLSLRDLSKAITSMGWVVDHSNLGQLIYAHTHLFPVIPAAFWSGLGRDGVKKLRKLLDNCRKYWSVACSDTQGSFDEFWPAVLSELDNEYFDFTEAENHLESEIALRLDKSITAVRAEIQAISMGISAEKEVNDIPKSLQPTGSEKRLTTPTTLRGDAVRPPALQPAATLETTSNNLQEGTFGSASGDSSLISLTTEQLTTKAFQLAANFAATFGFASCVKSAVELGFNGADGYHSGFVLVQPSNEDLPVFNDAQILYQFAYLYQLSSWFVADQSDPDMKLVSHSTPLSVMSEEDFFHATSRTFAMRMYTSAAHLQGQPMGAVWPLMCELESIIGIIMHRFEQHTQHVQGE